MIAAVACSGGGGGGPSGPTTPATSSPTFTPVSSPTASSGASSSPSASPTPQYIQETATSSDAFVDTIGINTHLNNPPYSTNLSATNTLITNLGVRHIRDAALDTGNNAALCANDVLLASNGVHFDFLTDPTFTPSTLSAWTSCVGAALEDYEGPNEYDIQHPQSDTNWPLTVQTFQQTLYTSVKGNAASANIPVFGPSFTTENAYASVGDLAAYEDFGNMHAGFAGFNPGTTGYGPGGYGSIAYNVALANIVGPGKPVVASETGYSTFNGTDGVSAAIQAKYVPRLYLELFRQGVVKTYDFELCDEPMSTGYESAQGIVDMSLTPKPAYTALQSLIALLSDPGPSFTPNAVSYVVSGAPPDVHHVTLEKRDGSFYIAIWREDESWDPNALTVIPIAPVQIQVTLSSAPASIEQYTYSASKMLISAAITPAASSFSLTITDSVSILHVVPGNSGSLSRSRRFPTTTKR